MALRVAVDDSLQLVKAILRAGGFDVVSLGAGVPPDARAIIVNGLDDNLLGQQSALSPVPVINAVGRTPEDVAQEVARRARA